jgi:preprotein translocase subunit YajC
MAASSGEGANPGATLFLFVGIFAILYFLLIRPQRQQQKSHDQMVTSLGKGDEVATIGGIVGKIVHITETRVTIRTADDTRLEIERDKVGRRLGEPGDK